MRNTAIDTKRAEESLNIAYESLRDKHLKKFDLTTESEQADATNYLNKNYKQISSVINAEIKDHF